jgi:hypothetical protein
MIVSSFIAGDSVEWEDAFSGPEIGTDGTIQYVPPTWTLTYEFRGPGSFSLTGAANTAGTGWDCTITAASSAGYIPGRYRWQAYVTKGAERHTVAEGSVEVLQNLSTTAKGYEARSNWRVIQEQCEAALANWSKDPYAEYEIAGRRQVWRLSEIVTLYNRAKVEVSNEEKAERIAQGLGGGKKILVRFT